MDIACTSVIEVPFPQEQLQQHIKGACSKQFLAAVEVLIKSGRSEVAQDKHLGEAIIWRRMKAYERLQHDVLHQLATAAIKQRAAAAAVDVTEVPSSTYVAGEGSFTLAGDEVLGSAVGGDGGSSGMGGSDSRSGVSSCGNGRNSSVNSSSSILLSAPGLALFLNASILFYCFALKSHSPAAEQQQQKVKKKGRKQQQLQQEKPTASAEEKLAAACTLLARLAYSSTQLEVRQFAVGTAPVILRLLVYLLQSQTAAICAKKLAILLFGDRGEQQHVCASWFWADQRSVIACSTFLSWKACVHIKLHKGRIASLAKMYGR